MLTWPWLLTAAALLMARRVSRRLERLTETYWELRYGHGQLRARVARLAPEAPPAPAPSQQPDTFIPFSSLKR